MTQKQKDQINHYLQEFARLANEFWAEGRKDNYEYWKGQVMGISHTVTALGLEDEIDTKYYLRQIP